MMRIAIIGRTEILYNAAVLLKQAGYIISCILTSKEALEYTRIAADFKALAEQWNIPFAQGPRIVEHLNLLKFSESEIAVSINYTGVVPQDVIDIFPLGILNAHGGDLPRYRGNACQAWAIINGEDRIGLCIHKMVGGELDSGDIIARDYLPIDHKTKVTQAWQWMTERTPSLILEAVQKLARNPAYVLEHQSKKTTDALRCYPRRQEDGRIDWNCPAIEILRLINASNKPYSGAFCNNEGRHMVIWDAELVEDGELFCAIPGQVTAIADNHIVVACGSGKLAIQKVQIEGDDECSPSRYITSIRKRLT